MTVKDSRGDKDVGPVSPGDGMVTECQHDGVVEGMIARRVRGGLSVVLGGGVPAFLPSSHVDVRPVRDLDALVGKTFQFQVLERNAKRGSIVLSRRLILEKARAELEGVALTKLHEGQVVDGVVKNLTDYGAFIDLGGVDGLLHVNDMSWGRVTHPSEVLEVGDRVRVKVLKLDADKSRVSLGIKQIGEDPWRTAGERYAAGTVVRGKVVSIKEHGAFVELEQGIEGLVDVGDMSWTRRVKHPNKIVAIGDTVEAVVLRLDAAHNRISLGMKQREENPFVALAAKYPPGTVVRGKVRNLADFGMFVEIEDGIAGLVHVSDMSWTARVKHPSDLFRKGDDVEAVILGIDTADADKPKIALGIKQLAGDPWDRVPLELPVGKTMIAKVTKVLDFGAFVELDQGIEGLIHVSEMGDGRVEDPRTVLEPGQTVEVEVISMDQTERKIGLSMKQRPSGATLGDLFRKKGASK